MFDGLCPFTICTVVTFTVVPFCMHGGDLCEADDGNLATAHSQLPQLPPQFSKDSLTAKADLFLPASRLWVESSNLSLLT